MTGELQPDGAASNRVPLEATAGPSAPPSPWPRRILIVVVGVAVVAFVAYLFAPLLVQEAPAAGAAVDTAPPLTGEGEQVTQTLRDRGYTCGDAVLSNELVTRVCSKVDEANSSRVELVVVAGTGDLKLARTSIDQKDPAKAHGELAAALARSVGLSASEQEAVRTSAASERGLIVTFGWGSFSPLTEDAFMGEFRAAGWTQQEAPASTATFGTSVDDLATAATARGYAFETAQVTSIRACSRNEGGYGYNLWLQGTDTYVSTIDLSVTAPFRTHTRSHWAAEMRVVLGGVDTDQARSLLTWVERNGDAPGAESVVDGLNVSFMSRPDQGTKETFGGVSASCGRSVDDISGCAP